MMGQGAWVAVRQNDTRGGTQWVSGVPEWRGTVWRWRLFSVGCNNFSGSVRDPGIFIFLRAVSGAQLEEYNLGTRQKLKVSK